MLIDLLELATNNALQYDYKSRERLHQLQGKNITLVVKPLGQSITVTPQPHGLEFSSRPSIISDVTLTATLGALIKIGRDGMDNAELQPGELEINGDPIVGQRFAQMLAELDVDWEELLAEHVGESPAVIITAGLSKARELAQGSQLMFKQHINKVLKDDLDILPGKFEVELFLDDVDTVRADTDRLQTRIKRLQSKLL